MSGVKGKAFSCLEFPLTVYPKKYAHGFCFAVLCCGYTLTDFPLSIRLTSLALWQSNDCPSASKATLMTMDKYFMWIHYERLHNHNKSKHNKTVCIFLGIYCMLVRFKYSQGPIICVSWFLISKAGHWQSLALRNCLSLGVCGRVLSYKTCLDTKPVLYQDRFCIFYRSYKTGFVSKRVNTKPA